MRKILVIVTIVFGAILLVGCKNKDTQEINKGEEKNIYALSSLASIDSIMEHEVNLKKRSLDQDIVEEIKEVELDYKSIIDGVLNGQSPMTVKETILEEADEYDKLIEIKLNLEGEKMVYELYLIETLVSEETKEDESEKSYKLTGKIIIGEKEYQISGKKELSEDIMQDTYIEMISSIYSYNPKYKFRNWLLSIAKNKAIDAYRRQKKEQTIDILEEEQTLPESPSNADSEVTASYYLSLLDDIERQVIILYTMEDMKFKDISFILEKPLGTVMWVYHKAIRKLKEAEGIS